MDAARSFGFVFLCITLIETTTSAPQYLPFRDFYPGYIKQENDGDVYSTGDADHGLRDAYSWLWATNYATDMSPYSPNAYMPPVVLGAMIPPVYEQSQFRSQHEGSESIDNEIWQLQRGRSDIDPIEDNDGMGYFYPKPKISFDLPQFTPLGSTTGLPPQEDATVTTTMDISITDKATTTEPVTTVKL